ncbi:MAG: transposase [Firmicutes bacterium]|nr:transposase [Bacillota bacterium]
MGAVCGGQEKHVCLTPLGKLVDASILRIPVVYSGVTVLNYVVMPNHVHMLLQISAENPVSLLTVIRSTKTIVTKQWGSSVWQRSFYEHTARNRETALRFWKYIDENPARWASDPNFA